MHIVVPRGPHGYGDVATVLNDLWADDPSMYFQIVQWSPVTFVECGLHGSECRAERAHKEVQSALHDAGIESVIQQGPALRCEPCAA